MSLLVDIRRRNHPFQLDVSFESGRGLTALFGRSGAGKTSVIDIIAGLSRPDEGRVVLDGEVLVDTARGIFVPRHRRRFGYVFQEARLFPHFSVRRNLLYGRWFAPRTQRSGTFDEVVDLLGLGGLLDRAPDRLSGGEKQRVAIGRALLSSPRMLLMDEPLASLDEGRKAGILPYIERLRDDAGVPIVYVSHSVAEVARLANGVVVLSDGRVVAAGPAEEVMGRIDLFPATGRAEAGAMLDAVVRRHDETYALSVLQAAGVELTVPRLGQAPGEAVRVWVRARDVMLSLEPPRAVSAQNVIPAVVGELADHPGAVVDVALDCAGSTLRARITRKSATELGLEPGRPVFAIVKSIAFGGRNLSATPGAADAGGEGAAPAADAAPD